MTEAKKPKTVELRNYHFWSFGFRYCLGFSASDLGFDPRLNYAQEQRIPPESQESPVS